MSNWSLNIVLKEFKTWSYGKLSLFNWYFSLSHVNLVSFWGMFNKENSKVFPWSNLVGTRYRWVIPYMVLVLVTSSKQALMSRERWAPPDNCFDASLSEQSAANPSSNKLFASLSDNHFEVKNTYRCKWTPAARRLGDLPHCVTDQSSLSKSPSSSCLLLRFEMFFGNIVFFPSFFFLS